MGPDEKDEEKPKSQSEMFEEERHKSFFGHIDGEEEEKKEEEKTEDEQ